MQKVEIRISNALSAHYVKEKFETLLFELCGYKCICEFVSVGDPGENEYVYEISSADGPDAFVYIGVIMVGLTEGERIKFLWPSDVKLEQG